MASMEIYLESYGNVFAEVTWDSNGVGMDITHTPETQNFTCIADGVPVPFIALTWYDPNTMTLQASADPITDSLFLRYDTVDPLLRDLNLNVAQPIQPVSAPPMP